MLNRFSDVRLFVTLWTVAHQAPLSMVFSRQEYWSGLPGLSPGDLSDPGIELALITGFFTTSTTWEFERLKSQFSSVTQSCPTLCYPMNRSTPGFPVHHQLPEFTQTHVHRVIVAIQPSHPLSPLLLLPPVPPSIRGFSNESALHIRWPKY